MTIEDKRMIPLSVIDAEIEILQETVNTMWHNYEVIELLEELKDKVVTIKQEPEQPLEQRIKDRIKEIEGYPIDHWDCYDDHNQMLIDELRELVEK